MEMPEGCTVIADGLINPRFLTVGDDGTVYVTEAGLGGDEELPAIEGAPPLGTRGNSGQVSAIAPDGTVSVVADGFASYQEGVGPAGIVNADGALWITVGGAAISIGLEQLDTENTVQRIDLTTGEVTQVAELGSYEEANNPDGTDVNPNLYGMDLGAEGALYVADAGGNTVYRIDPATGEFTLLGIVPGPALGDGPPAEEETNADDSEASPIADEETAGPPQAVPTGVHVGADGNVYVVTLGAFIPGAAGAYIAQADGSFVQAAGGLSVALGVALGPDGSLYISQLASFTSESEPPGPGSVVRVGADGTIESAVDGIPTPHGIAFDAAGNLYVVANSTTLGPPAPEPMGQIWRCDGVAAA
jgi:hypothetical protein